MIEHQANTTSQFSHAAFAQGVPRPYGDGREDADPSLSDPPLSTQSSFKFETGAQLLESLRHQGVTTGLKQQTGIQGGSSSGSDSSSSFLGGAARTGSARSSPDVAGSIGSSAPSAPIPIKKGSSGKWLEVAAESRSSTPRAAVSRSCLETFDCSSSGLGREGSEQANFGNVDTLESGSGGLGGDGCGLATRQLGRIGMVVSDEDDDSPEDDSAEDDRASGTVWGSSSKVGVSSRRGGSFAVEGTEAEASGLVGGWQVLEAYSSTPGEWLGELGSSSGLLGLGSRVLNQEL